jgi:hypothetical protein
LQPEWSAIAFIDALKIIGKERLLPATTDVEGQTISSSIIPVLMSHLWMLDVNANARTEL